MTKEELIEQIERFIPSNEEEKADKEVILHALKTEENIFSRENQICHVTSSCWIVNKDWDKVLLCYHKIFQSWSWLGGHNDGEVDCLKVALKEAKEESGLSHFQILNDGKIFSLEILTADAHYRKGVYVPSHLHLNLTYLLQEDEKDRLIIKEDENSGLRWANLEDVYTLSTEKWVVEHVYKKLNQKLSILKKKRDM